MAAEIAAAFRRKCEVVGVFVNPTLEEVARAVEDEQLTMVQLNGAEGASFCAEVARRTGAQGDQGDPRRQRRRRPRRRGLPHRLPPLRPPRQGPLGRHRRELRLGAPARPPLRGAGDPRRRPAARTTSPPRSRSPSPTRSTSPAASSPSRAARTTRRWRPSSRPRNPVDAPTPHERGRGAVRPLRGALRAGDADRGARRADRGLGGGARGRRVHRPARAAAARLHRPADAALPGRAALRAGRLAGST